MSQTVPVSQTGAEYTWPLTITEQTGKDISGCTVQVSLGTYDAPGDWATPDVDNPQENKATRVVQLLIDDDTTAGTYYLWTKVTDSPETIIRRHERITIT